MGDHLTRRQFVAAAGTAAGAGLVVQSAAGAEAASSGEKKLIVGVACSPRRGMTTATAIRASLDAAAAVDPRIEPKLLDLGGRSIAGWTGGARPGEGQQVADDFDALLPVLQAPNLGGLIIGSPVYFRALSALCKAFLERLAVLRTPNLALADKPVGVLAVGGYRNGGQELVIDQIQTAMLCHEVMIVGGKPRAHQGATLWNAYDDDITKDEFGMDTARKLGARVAEAALRISSHA